MTYLTLETSRDLAKEVIDLMLLPPFPDEIFFPRQSCMERRVDFLSLAWHHLIRIFWGIPPLIGWICITDSEKWVMIDSEFFLKAETSVLTLAALAPAGWLRKMLSSDNNRWFWKASEKRQQILSVSTEKNPIITKVFFDTQCKIVHQNQFLNNCTLWTEKS